MKQLTAILICIMLALSSTFLLTDVSEETEGKAVHNGVEYITHAPIRINSNADFDDSHGVVNWATGDGTPGNPWIIENWDINGSGIGTCLFVGNTTDYFEIKNCHLHEANGTYGWPLFRNAGIHLYYASNGTIENNTAHSNDYTGVLIFYSDNNNITDCRIYDNNWGVFSEASNYNRYIGNIVYQNNKGIWLARAGFSVGNFSLISNNNISDNGIGIIIDYSFNNTVLNNSICWNGGGISISECESNIVQDNNISYNDEDYYAYGLYLSSTEHNIILNNTLFYNWGSAIEVSSSPNNTFSDNIMINGGFCLRGAQVYHFNTQSIDASNTLNGKLIYYGKNQTGGSVPSNVGQILLANCTNMTIENFTFQNLYSGIILGCSENITINNVTSIYNVEGIYTLQSNYNTIKNCTLSYNDEIGLWLFMSKRNDVHGNIMSSNGYWGIWLHGSSNNTIHNNNISFNNEYGIDATPKNNYIFNNNFINNIINQSYSEGGINFWNMSIPIGGNYWSDYTGSDGNGDGFGDTPYIIPGIGGNLDYYPLMGPGSPTINLTKPDGDEVWEVGTHHYITWTMTDNWDDASALRVTLDYSVDGGVSFPFNIITNQTGFGESAWYDWQIPDTPSTNCIMRVTVEDTTRNSVVDISTAPFTIPLNPPTIWLSVPNGGEFYNGGGSRLVNWTASAGRNPLLADPITIEYSSTGQGGPWTLVASGETNDGYYLWNPVPMINSTDCFVRVTVQDTGGLSAQDTSNNSFEIDSDPPLPATNPRAELTGTNDVTIYWEASPSADVAGYNIYYVTNGWDPTGSSYSLLGSSVGTSYTHSGAGNNSGTEYCYQVRVCDRAGNEARALTQAVKMTKILSTSQSNVGWYMVGSFLAQSSYDISHKIQGMDIQTSYDFLEAYNAWDSADHWKTYPKNAPAGIQEMSAINNTQGFWIHVTANCRFASAGCITNMSVPLKAGWNLIPYPYAVKYKTTQSIVNDLIANCSGFTGGLLDLEIFNKTAPYKMSTPTGIEALTHQDAFWVRVTSDCVWNIANY